MHCQSEVRYLKNLSQDFYLTAGAWAACGYPLGLFLQMIQIALGTQEKR